MIGEDQVRHEVAVVDEPGALDVLGGATVGGPGVADLPAVVGDGQVDAAVVDVAAARDDVEVLPVAPLLPGVPGVQRGRYGQLWPHRHGTDAMFMALLRRTR